MRRSRFTDEQIASILDEYRKGSRISQLSQKYNVSGATIYSWNAKLQGRPARMERAIKQLEEENRRLKERLIDALIDNEVLRDLLRKKRGTPQDPAAGGAG
ncbi:MAG: transposase [Parvibaculum sp.]|uniref:transposase n=1 Tax=Parvibaculum sp. TaxID=2024848 RepID=UPI003C7965E1